MKRIEACRGCKGTSLEPILDLGELYVSDFVCEQGKAIRAPLALVLCKACVLVQLSHRGVERDSLYRQYWYLSGVNPTMVAALEDIVASIERIVQLKKGDVVSDIGSNDGTLLRAYSVPGLFRLGFEPARNLMQEGSRGGNKIVVDYFGYWPYQRVTGGQAAKAITTIAMFYDLKDPNAFVHDLWKVLAPDGVWVNQMAYLPAMLEQNAFDNICHEHLEYYSLTSLDALLRRHGLQIFDVELNDVNGGSFRVYAKHAVCGRYPVSAAVGELLQQEREMGLSGVRVYQEFAQRVENIRREVMEFIHEAVGQGKSVYLYGASTKGNTLLQYFGLDSKVITAAAERSPAKWGLRTVGTDIPIISEEQARKENPDYFLVLPWHFLDHFLEREQEYLDNGGHFIVPLPRPRVI